MLRGLISVFLGQCQHSIGVMRHNAGNSRAVSFLARIGPMWRFCCLFSGIEVRKRREMVI